MTFRLRRITSVSILKYQAGAAPTPTRHLPQRGRFHGGDQGGYGHVSDQSSVWEHRAMAGLRKSEMFAFAVIAQALDAEVVSTDDGSLPAMADAHIRYPDGRYAGLEVTALARGRELEMEALAAGSNGSWSIGRFEGLKLAWTCRWQQPSRVKEIIRWVPSLAALCEKAGVNDPDLLLAQEPSDPALRWYETAAVSMSGVPAGSTAGKIYLLPEAIGGAIDESLTGLTPWVSQQAQQPWMLDNVAKLVATGLTELHLFVPVHQAEMPFPLLCGLIDPPEDPPGHPELPAGLTDLWLAPRFSQVLIRWSTTTGWTTYRYSDLSMPSNPL